MPQNNIIKSYYLLFFMLQVPLCSYGVSLKSITSWIPTSLVAQETEQNSEEYTLRHGAAIHVSLKCGSVQIETWGKPYAMVQTTKRAISAEDLAQMSISIEHSPTSLKITAEQEPQSLIDIALLVPATSNCTITIHEQGSIVATSVPRTCKMHTNNGNITISTQTDGAINANTDQGNISATCNAFSQESSILLTAPQGEIILALPSLTQAHIEATSKKASIFSELPITFEPFTTVLTKKSWKQLCKQVRGTIGDGEAPITLRARNNITIKKSLLR